MSSKIIRYNLNNIDEVRRLRKICDQCEHCFLDHYCTKHNTDSMVFLINKCDKLKER